MGLSRYGSEELIDQAGDGVDDTMVLTHESSEDELFVLDPVAYDLMEFMMRQVASWLDEHDDKEVDPEEDKVDSGAD